MEDERIDVEQESSPVEDVEVEDSSTQEEEQAEVAEPTAEQGTQEQNVPYDRFKEVNEEKNYWRGQAERLSQPTPVKEEEDPYANIQDPQAKLFWQELDKRVEKRANKIADERTVIATQQNQALARQLANIQHKVYKSENVDVVEGSAEEQRIAQLVSTGIMSMEEATWAVMGQKRAAKAVTQKQQKQVKKTEMKAKANLSTGGIPAQSGLPQAEEKGFLDDLSESLDKSWDGRMA